LELRLKCPTEMQKRQTRRNRIMIRPPDNATDQVMASQSDTRPRNGQPIRHQAKIRPTNQAPGHDVASQSGTRSQDVASQSDVRLKNSQEISLTLQTSKPINPKTKIQIIQKGRRLRFPISIFFKFTVLKVFYLRSTP
jgi:hypothetical protein